jgi:hypothetical protein
VTSLSRYAPTIRYKKCLKADLSVKKPRSDAKDMPNGSRWGGTCNET